MATGSTTTTLDATKSSQLEALEAKLAHDTMTIAFNRLAKTIQPDDPVLDDMCDTAKQAKKCMLMARERIAQIKALESLDSHDIDEVHRLRAEIGALHFNAGPFCIESSHQAIFNATVTLAPAAFEAAVIKAAADTANVTLGHVTTVPSRLLNGALGVNLTPVTFDSKAVEAVEAVEAFGFANFDPLADNASLYADGPENSARYYAKVRDVTKSSGFKLNAIRAMYKAAQTLAVGKGAEPPAFDSREAAVCRVWLEILAVVETAASDASDASDIIDIIPLFHAIEKKSVAATVVQTACSPSLALLESIASRPSIQEGDFAAFASSYAASVEKMTAGLEPGQYSYYVIDGAPPAAAMAPPPKRARTLGASGRESTSAE
jgi:hypothetical protein